MSLPPVVPAPTRGRFAPSPTGPLHFGSLVAALGSYADARASGGAWLVRMEDLDPPREMPGAADDILRTLEGFGFAWDGPVLRQSIRGARYAEVLDHLARRGLTYPCGCSRSEIAAAHAAARPASASPGLFASTGEMPYPGTCRAGLAPGRIARATRFRVDDAVVRFVDRMQGPITQRLAIDVGDFVLKRADGPWAYQLAVVVDDADQGVTDVVRGADLLDSTPRQIRLIEAIGARVPRYLHLPVAVNAAGEKLSKQTLAPAIDPAHAGALLVRALDFLGQSPPTDLATAVPADVLAWAVAHWDVARIPRTRAIAVPA
jgi:glutamyl-Q tRNA(Asp) synthetase